MKLDAWSDWSSFARPYLVKNWIRASTTFLAVILLKETASENRVDTSMMINRNWKPDLVLGKGPTQSTKTLLYGSSKVGIGIRGAGLTAGCGFPTIWHTWHVRKNWATSLYSWGHQKWAIIWERVLWMLTWPARDTSCTRCRTSDQKQRG